MQSQHHVATGDDHPLTKASREHGAAQAGLYTASRLYCLRYEAQPIVSPSEGWALEEETNLALAYLREALQDHDRASEVLDQEMRKAPQAV
jgi:hypothetical protein